MSRCLVEEFVCTWGKLLCTFDKKHGAATVPYPIAVDVYCDAGIIVARAKSKSGLYKYEENFVLEKATPTKSEKKRLQLSNGWQKNLC